MRAQRRRGPGEHFGEPERVGVLPGPREQYVGRLAPRCFVRCSHAQKSRLGALTGLASPGRFEVTLFSKADLSLRAKSISQSEMIDFMLFGKEPASCLALCG